MSTVHPENKTFEQKIIFLMVLYKPRTMHTWLVTLCFPYCCGQIVMETAHLNSFCMWSYWKCITIRIDNCHLLERGNCWVVLSYFPMFVSHWFWRVFYAKDLHYLGLQAINEYIMWIIGKHTCLTPFSIVCRERMNWHLINSHEESR